MLRCEFVIPASVRTVLEVKDDLPINLPPHSENSREEGPVLIRFERLEFLRGNLHHTVLDVAIPTLLSQLGWVSEYTPLYFN